MTDTYVRLEFINNNGSVNFEAETTLSKVGYLFKYAQSNSLEAFVYNSVGRVIGHQWCEQGIWKHYLEN